MTGAKRIAPAVPDVVSGTQLPFVPVPVGWKAFPGIVNVPLFVT